MRQSDEFAQFIEPVARALLGDPNVALSNGVSLRFGAHGSLHVNLTTGTWFSHEDQIGGGVLDLIKREKQLQGKDAFDYLRDIGCHTGDDNSKINLSPQPRARIVATYDYTDENGDVLFHVCRFEPKKFLQRAPNGDWTVKGIRQVPYRLPELIEAIAMDKTIFIVEGEKDADNLARWNIAATCNAGGAGKWRADFADLFHGADVVVVPDNDTAGRDHADMAARSLQGIARRVRQLSLPGLPAKGDFSDYQAAHPDIEAFHALVARAPVWAPRLESKFGGLCWEQIGIAGQRLGYAWLVEDIIPMAEITLAFGDSGTGKSFNIFDLSMCVARGILFNGRNVEPGLVVYVAAEAGKGFAKRKLAYQQHHQIGDEALPFYLLTKRPDFFSSDEHVDAVIAEIRMIEQRYGRKSVLIVFDTLSALAPGMNENASQDVSKVRQRFVKVNEAFDAAQIIVHHKPKGGSTPRGHGSLTADFETTIEFETDPSRVSPEGLPVHRATVRKQREGKKGENWEFVLPVVEVGKNKWGNAETSCVVTAVTSSSKAVTGFKLNPTEIVFMDSLFEALLQAPTLPPPGLPEQITKAVDSSLVRSIMKTRLISAEEDEASADQRFRTAYSRAGSQLAKYGVIGHRKPLMWFTGKPLRGVKVPEAGL